MVFPQILSHMLLPYFPVYKRPFFVHNFHFKNRGSLIHGSKSFSASMYCSSVIIKSFKKCGISNAMDGTEDDAIFEQSDSSDDNDEELADKESDEEFNDFYD